MGRVLVALRIMVDIPDARCKLPTSAGNVLCDRGVSFLDFTPFQFILFGMGHEGLPSTSNKSAEAFCFFPTLAGFSCFWCAVSS